MRKLKEFAKNVMCMQHQLEAYALDLRDGSHVTCFFNVMTNLVAFFEPSQFTPVPDGRMNRQTDERSGVRDRILQLVYSYLQSIRPTSVEAERAFSVSETLCTN